MAKKQLTISVDEQWLDAIDRNSKPGFCLVQTLESLVVDLIAKVLVSEQECTAVSRAIAHEKSSRSLSVIAKNSLYNIITVTERGTSPSFMVWDEGLYSIIEKIRDYPKVKKHFASTFCEMFPGKLILHEDKLFDGKVAEYLFHPELSDVACIYSIDLDTRQLGILKKWTDTKEPRAFASWRFFKLDGICSLLDAPEEDPIHGFTDTIWYYLDDYDLHIPFHETPNIYISGIREFTEGEVVIEDEVYLEGTILSSYLTSFFDPDSIFGTHVCTEENNHFVSARVCLDLTKDNYLDDLTVIVEASPLPDECYIYRLSPKEKDLICNAMDKCLKTPDDRGFSTSLERVRNEHLRKTGKGSP